jgi:hypothetical protein
MPGGVFDGPGVTEDRKKRNQTKRQRFPRVDTLAKILGALGFRMLFVPVDNTEPEEQNPVSKSPSYYIWLSSGDNYFPT